ncbi:3914_t:CDS:10 [Entrophospora sp. SA101]|nr:3914_t:CDS:10 [Entrophospora sp. SA101]CAJ0904793.1 5769_t:CDS:10 [Entrophospora sp. SA101]
MTPKTRSLINNKSPIDIEPYKSKFFTSVYSSEESSIEGLKQKSINETTTEDESEEELKLSSRGLVQIVGSLDISLLDNDAPLLFNNQVDEFDVTLDPPSNSLQLTTRNVRKYDDPLENKRRQGRLLLVSLLENFCLLYDTNPERNHELFYLICKNLSTMGIIEEEHIDEMSTVRSSYQRAFKALVIQALNSIKQERLMKESRLLMPSCPETDLDKPDRHSPHDNKLPYSAKTKKDNSNSKVLKNLSFGDILDLENSRYSNDFIELKLLGKGGFASAKNKLDGREYAIKKIRLRGDKIPEEKEKIFREIKILARLEHTNVVRYYSSWLEHISSKQRSNEDETSLLLNSEENSSRVESSNGYHSDNESSINSNQDSSDIFRMSFSDDDGIDFVDDISAAGKLNSDFNNTPTHTTNTNYIYNKKNNNRLSQNYDTFKADKISHSHIPKDVESLNLEKDWVLFIQMQLCNSTLRDYLKKRDSNILAPTTDLLSSVDHNIIIDLFRGIVRGVAYIHDQGLIHRDLKPGNIFIGGLADGGQDNLAVANNLLSFSNERVVPKIGDFGLVTAVDGDHTYSTIDNSINRGLKGCYASPEQLARPPQPYNEKVDIYSLGIIFFELHFSFSTGHERAQVIKNLRNGILPKGFVKRFPKEAAFILWMMAEDPDKRPSAKQILDFELLSDSNQEEHSKIQLRLVESTHKLEMVTQENEILKKKVAELEEKLKKYENLITYNTKGAS